MVGLLASFVLGTHTWTLIDSYVTPGSFEQSIYSVANLMDIQQSESRPAYSQNWPQIVTGDADHDPITDGPSWHDKFKPPTDFNNHTTISLGAGTELVPAETTLTVYYVVSTETGRERWINELDNIEVRNRFWCVPGTISRRYVPNDGGSQGGGG